jgi:plasmid stabilization system protein ParE
MASAKAELAVILSAAAVNELADIWAWHAEHCDPLHANAYLAYLKPGIDNLSARSAVGRQVADHPELRYTVFRRQANGHGHVAVYRVDGRIVHVLHVFHTAQDWQAGLGRDESQ